jgi:2-dehydro-3-deoxygluconokinase
MQSPLLDVVVFGEAMAMFIADDYAPLEMAEHYTRGLAGAEVNVATGLARLGYRVGWVSRLGVDPLGRFILNEVRRSGIDTARVLFDDVHPTGFQLKSRVQVGDPQVIYFRRGSAASFMAPNAEDDAYIRSARHLHVTGIPAALSESCRRYTYHAIEQAREAGMSVSFDPNLRPVLWKSVEEMRAVLNDIARKADWLFPGLSEGTLLTGYTTPEDVAKFYLDQGVKLVVVKVGTQGSSLFTAQQRYDMPAFTVQVVDTVGAGDGFAVGIISGMLEGLSPLQCLERGNAIGALAVMAPGDQEGLPVRETLNRFLELQKYGRSENINAGEMLADALVSDTSVADPQLPDERGNIFTKE